MEKNLLAAALSILAMGMLTGCGSFGPHCVDCDKDGLPDDWERLYSLNPDDSGRADANNGPLGDPDYDKSSNLEEYTAGTNPRAADADQDGLADGAERAAQTNPLKQDTDDDGLSDGREVAIHTDPLKSDTDGDGLTDMDEIQSHRTNPCTADSDQDGLSDFDEVKTLGTDPTKNDTDNDGLSDNAEHAEYGTSPILADTDGDGASDGQEIRAGTDPKINRGDTDGDRLTDDLELVLRTDPADSDTDKDWASDGFEVTKGKDPLNASSTPRLETQVIGTSLQAPDVSSRDIEFTFPGLVADDVIITEMPRDPIFDHQTTGAAASVSSFQTPWWLAAPACVTNHLAATVPYTLATDKPGWHIVMVKATRGTEEIDVGSPNITLDTDVVELSITNPPDGYVTAEPWITVSGRVSDKTGVARVLVNGEWPDQQGGNRFLQSRIGLSPGTNVIVVTARDEAGHTVTQRVRVVQNLQMDQSAPVASLSVPGEDPADGQTVEGPATPTYCEREIWVHGSIDDPKSTVQLTTSTDQSTNGPFNALVSSSSFWCAITLSPGTNDVQLVASDAAGNSTSTHYAFAYATDLFFRVTYPEAFQVMNAPSTKVKGVASKEFERAKITVNGVPARLSVDGDTVNFETERDIPLNADLTALRAKAELDGRVYWAE